MLKGQSGVQEDSPAYNALVARSFLIEVSPLVEKYTGWNCDWPVAFRLVTRKEYIEQVLAETTQMLQKKEPALDPKRVESALTPSLATQSIGLLGRFSTFSHQMYLLPGNLAPVMRELGVEQRFTRDLIEVVLAHELTHYVQDSKFKITDRALLMSSKDERTAWTMLVEGHATWVQERVAAELGLSEAATRFSSQMMERHRTLAAMRNEDEPANVRGYLQGKKFIEAIFAKGGLSAVQKLFVDPPKSPRLIENPTEYLKLIPAK
jgi:hypothetical protein